MRLYFLHILFILFGVIYADKTKTTPTTADKPKTITTTVKPLITNCYDCASKLNRKMCIPGGPSNHHYEGACCLKDDKSPACTPSGTSNICSPI